MIIQTACITNHYIFIRTHSNVFMDNINDMLLRSGVLSRPYENILNDKRICHTEISIINTVQIIPVFEGISVTKCSKTPAI